ncbi:glycerol-3-phosphate dehydrogenase (NAD(P)+) [Chitinophaga ginsengisegetis]|uniref:Glycerol-3-phosphate dehydrogenase n=1 Tax=Chitinophaga ginsengisegetis TaxID=393003 RepID=A0A1T5P5V2_9BACT|nr:NAD(P)H-dependent glycerol-3-phosphate dehydrogenase [Chitinophaga ginsengisegetis]MDR6566442.1 glycerol-3-phosphate dehydrogenase (NAD(P)+) [Chitinophaga ginsengisegetis]MDR6646172.1 glycerol-3-phosphate dehydrogenase (NAD(P)+) [Chitinophaga ginsengisegetis]MDR6651236.1 glycerol-3-phosphate dehydrogenase (NAD(P)+) [Chitinophaga ginsengisegetis]SKD08026.1 glycerol-3-phosphate dehydrogenase (NAD(P)+) [Chitinophaga ginsengisegetis]
MSNSIGIIGSGSWATALAKILTDNGHHIHWWIRNDDTIRHMQLRHHNKHYLTSVYFDTSLLSLSSDVKAVVAACDELVLAVPSAFLEDVLSMLPADALINKRVISAIKGLVPSTNDLIGEYLLKQFNLPASQYFTITGPCHAEEVASEKLSYLTFSGAHLDTTQSIADKFTGSYLQTIVNTDVIGVQLAAVLKNIYAMGAGIAHGQEYGDNFLSVFITNCFREMQSFLEKYEEQKATIAGTEPVVHNYSASAYLGDLLVTCYSLHSRNRTFGNMIGKGYSVKAAQLELNMIAEGYYASKCMHEMNRNIGAYMPVAEAVYAILWQQVHPSEAFLSLEKGFI